jgi:hypothetical protein
MGYGVNTWATQLGRARAAASSKGSGTRTAKKKSSASARRAKKKPTRRSLPPRQKGGSLWKAAQSAGWTDRQSFEDWAGDPSHAKEVARLKARYQAYQESGR